MMYVIMLATLVVTAVALYFAYKDKLVAGIGAALYVLMPYRVYICFNVASIRQALFWLLLPVLLMCLVRLYKSDKYRFIWILPAILIVSGTAYLDATHAVILAGVILLMALFLQKYLYIPIALLGLAGSVAANINYWRFILLGHENAYSVPAVNIADKGYYFGYYFMNWTYSGGRPGIGFGIMFSLIIVLWSFLSDKEKKADRCVVASFILGVMAFHWGVWDMLERVHPIVLRLLSSMGTPGVMLGFACAIMCIPASKAMAELFKGNIIPASENNRMIVSKLIPIFILIMNLVAAVYQVVTVR